MAYYKPQIVCEMNIDTESSFTGRGLQVRELVRDFVLIILSNAFTIPAP